MGAIGSQLTGISLGGFLLGVVFLVLAAAALGLIYGLLSALFERVGVNPKIGFAASLICAVGALIAFT
ncbi:MAG: hypothetical protein ACREBO_09175 [Novosphingobium sp.]